MEPATHNLVIYQDRDFSQTFFLKSAGVAMNLTGYTVKAEVRPDKYASDLIVAFTIVVIKATGSITLSLTDTQTLVLTDEVAFWDLVLTDPLGKRLNYIEGTLTVRGTVTRGEA